MTTDPPSLQPGTVLSGKYRVERVLGAGGMGFVVAAMHLELHQLVAMKFLHAGMLANGEAVARFVREARAAARIRSEHVARVIDVGRLEDGAPYMVMEFLQGRDLGAVLEQGALPVSDAVEWVIQACHAVAEAHAAGIVHRDLKPSNLFLTERADGVRVVKVLDFGISKLTVLEPFEPQLTNTKSAMGSPLYMSPEQMRSFKDVDARTDIWSLGVILYELLSGKPPFRGDSLHELVTALVMSTPASLHAERAEVSPELESAVMRCLEKDPALRYQSVAELARELLPFAPQQSYPIVERVERLSGSSRPPQSDSSRPAPLSHDPSKGDQGWRSAAGARTGAPWSSTNGSPAPVAKKKPILFVGVAAVLAAFALSVVFALTRGPAPATTASAVPPDALGDPSRLAPIATATVAHSAAIVPVAPAAASAPGAAAPVAPVPTPSSPPASTPTRAAKPPRASSTAAGVPARAPAVAATAGASAPTASSSVRRRTFEIDLK